MLDTTVSLTTVTPNNTAWADIPSHLQNEWRLHSACRISALAQHMGLKKQLNPRGEFSDHFCRKAEAFVLFPFPPQAPICSEGTLGDGLHDHSLQESAQASVVRLQIILIAAKKL